MSSEKSSLADHLVGFEFASSLADIPSEITPTDAQTVLSYLTTLHYIGERPTCNKICEYTGLGSAVNAILRRLEKVKWIKGKYGKGQRFKVYQPTSRGEDILKKCELPPYG